MVPSSAPRRCRNVTWITEWKTLPDLCGCPGIIFPGRTHTPLSDSLPTEENYGHVSAYQTELFGTFWLVFGGCGAAVLAASFPALGIRFLEVAFAFGLTVLTMAYAVGLSGSRHFQPGGDGWAVGGGALLQQTSFPISWRRWSVRWWRRRCSGCSHRASPAGSREALRRTAMAISAPANTDSRPARRWNSS